MMDIPGDDVDTLNKQVVLVTGGSRGIGRAIAARFAANGAAVGVNYVSHSAEADSVVNEIHATGGRAIAVHADIGDPAQVDRMVARIGSELGPISILINNAALSFKSTLDSYDPAVMERMRRINVDGLIHVTRAVVPGMRERRYGRIVNLTSVAAHGTSFPDTTFYAATKAAVIALTRRFALELGRHGITVNAVAPGFVLTDMVHEGRTEEEFRRLLNAVTERAMVGRAGRPEDIANAVVFLAAPESEFITAQVLTVDGGRTDYIAHP
jgi:3-oxoacyl-[acyl-carrier protein] reductase